MRCQAPNDPHTGRCTIRAAVTLKNGTKLCKPCARKWAETRIERHTRDLAEARRVLKAAGWA